MSPDQRANLLALAENFTNGKRAIPRHRVEKCYRRLGYNDDLLEELMNKVYDSPVRGPASNFDLLERAVDAWVEYEDMEAVDEALAEQ